MLTNEITDVRSMRIYFSRQKNNKSILFIIDAISVMKERSQTTEHNKIDRTGQLTNREPNEYV